MDVWDGSLFHIPKLKLAIWKYVPFIQFVEGGEEFLWEYTRDFMSGFATPHHYHMLEVLGKAKRDDVSVFKLLPRPVGGQEGATARPKKKSRVAHELDPMPRLLSDPYERLGSGSESDVPDDDLQQYFDEQQAWTDQVPVHSASPRFKRGQLVEHETDGVMQVRRCYPGSGGFTVYCRLMGVHPKTGVCHPQGHLTLSDGVVAPVSSSEESESLPECVAECKEESPAQDHEPCGVEGLAVGGDVTSEAAHP